MEKRIRSKDRIGALPDELIHHILSFVEDTRLAVQTSILSSRWKLIWTTLPFISFNERDRLGFKSNKHFQLFRGHVLSRRNGESQVLKLELNYEAYIGVDECVVYAILHHVQDLTVNLRRSRKYSYFNSKSLKKLNLALRCANASLYGDDYWDLPALTTLHFRRPTTKYPYRYKLQEEALMRLPALTTLCIDGCELPESSSSFSLPALTTLCIARCKLPEKVWNFSALKSLELDGIVFPENMTDFLSALVSLRNLTLIFPKMFIQDCFISCPQLVNLKICTSMSTHITRTRKIVVSSPKLQNFNSVGIFPVSFEVHDLENVYINLWDIMELDTVVVEELKKKYYHRFTLMFSALGSTKILTLDLATIEALLLVSDVLVHISSPFHNLKYVKLPQGYEISSISSTLRRYLLGGSPSATIVTTLPQIT